MYILHRRQYTVLPLLLSAQPTDDMKNAEAEPEKWCNQPPGATIGISVTSSFHVIVLKRSRKYFNKLKPNYPRKEKAEEAPLTLCLRG